MDLPLVVLRAPDQEYLSLSELAHWLRLGEEEVRDLVKTSLIPAAKKRRGRARATWSREDAAVAKWIVDNSDRFGPDKPQAE